MATQRIPDLPLENLRTWTSQAVDAEGLKAELERSIEGEVRFDDGSRALYSADASNYRQVPIGVVIPKTTEDVVATVAACRKFGAPVLSRGGGTSLAGQCCNVAVVMDFSKYLNKILEISPQNKYARVQPGTVCDDVVNATRKYKLTYAPDPATHDHCCFGGMLGNNSCGAHAQMHGAASNNTEAMDVLLFDGTRMHLDWMSEQEWDQKLRVGGREGEIYAKLKSLRQRYQSQIEERYPKIPRRVSGYNLDQLIPNQQGKVNFSRALVGSEGTCVTILEAKVTLVYNHPERVVLVLGYPDIFEAADHLMEILEYQPIALEGIDDRLIEFVEKKGGPHRQFLPILPHGRGWLMVELGCETRQEAAEQARRLMDKLGSDSHAPSMKLLEDPEDQKKIWELRESGLGATAFVPGQPDSWPGWEDSAVAPEKVGGYLRDLRQLFDNYGYKPSTYGHFGQGCIHCRVDFDLFTEKGVKKYRSFMEAATDLVVSYGGSLSGEHGDGQARAEFLDKMFGPDLMQALREFKAIWDPDWKMNPGKVVEPYRIDENFRYGPSYHPREPKTHFQFPEDNGSFAHATMRCVGVGECRRKKGKPDNDTMCPSYMVTHEEEHTTRGRAHALWEMLHGDVITNGWRDEHVKQALDLCLSCKGCKGDCPVNVDMATYKAEFLSHYWEGRIRPRYAYAFGLIDKWARLASFAPGFTNLFTQLPLLNRFAKLAAGMPQEREIPAFATETFKSWFKKHKNGNRPSIGNVVAGPGRGGVSSGKRVVLWPDTFNNYFCPETAIAAVEVLEAAGYRVIVPEQHLCCGRPLYDYGFLSMAKVYLSRVLEALGPELDAGTPIVALEPSCCSVFRDEVNGLFPKSARAHRLMEHTFTFAEFLERESANHGLSLPALKRQAIVHGHCHHKAIMRLKEEKAVMDKMELDYRLLTSGCCGMAGSFGFEAEKYDISIDIGERVLLPEVRKAGLTTFIIADGFSCKEQIHQQTNRHGVHLAEVMALAQRHGKHGPDGIYPEKEIIEPRIREQKRSMRRAGLITVGALLTVGVLTSILRHRGKKN
jgi:FAD/FMN-containing dehydrogenase/Fe-S oxidoreductase